MARSFGGFARKPDRKQLGSFKRVDPKSGFFMLTDMLDVELRHTHSWDDQEEIYFDPSVSRWAKLTRPFVMQEKPITNGVLKREEDHEVS